MEPVLSIDDLRKEAQSLEGEVQSAFANWQRLEGALTCCRALIVSLERKAEQSETEESNEGEVVPFKGAASPGD